MRAQPRHDVTRHTTNRAQATRSCSKSLRSKQTLASTRMQTQRRGRRGSLGSQSCRQIGAQNREPRSDQLPKHPQAPTRRGRGSRKRQTLWQQQQSLLLQRRPLWSTQLRKQKQRNKAAAAAAAGCWMWIWLLEAALGNEDGMKKNHLCVLRVMDWL